MRDANAAPERPVRLTDRARARLRDIVRRRGGEGRVVRLYAERTSPTGLECGLSLDTERPGDRVVDDEALRIVADPESLAIVDGLVIDFVDAAEGAGFTFSRAGRPTPVGRT